MAETVKYVIEADISDFVSGMLASGASADAADKKIRSSLDRTDKKTQSVFNRLRSSFNTFDGSLDKSTDLVRDWNVAMRSVNTTTLVIGATTASGAVLGLAAAASQAVGALYALPAAAISVGAILATLRVGFGGIGTAVKALGKASKGAAGGAGALNKQLAGFDKMNVLTDSSAGGAAMADLADAMDKLSPAAQAVARALYEIGQSFLENVAKPVQEALFKGVAPALLYTYGVIEGPLRDSLVTVATALNGFLLEMLRVMALPFFSDLIRQAGELGAYIVSSLTPVIEPLARGIAALFEVGIPYIKLFVDGISGIIIRWGEWMQTAEGKNSVKDSIDQSIQALQILGGLFGSVFGVLRAIFDAVGDAIFGPINAITALTNRFEAWLRTTAGITFVSNLLNITTNAINALSDSLAIVGTAFSGVVNWFNSLDDSTQQTIIKVGIFVGTITGLIGYVDGLLSPLRSIAAAILDFVGPLTGASGALGSFSNFLKAIGGPIGIVAGLLIGMYTQSEAFRDAINGLVTSLGSALMPVFEALGPLLGIVFEALGSIVSTLGTALAPIIVALTPLLTLLGQTLSAVLVPIFQVLGFIIQNAVVPAIQGVLVVIGALATFLAQVFVGYIQLVGTVWSTIFTAILNVAKNIWDGIVAVWSVVAKFFTDLFNSAWEGIKTAFSPFIQWFSDLWNKAVEGVNWYFNTLRSGFTIVVNWISTNVIQPIGNFFKGLWDGVTSAVNNVGTTIRNAFTAVYNFIRDNIVTPIGNFFKGLWDGIANGVKGLGDTVKNIFNGIVSVIKSPLNVIIDGFNTMIRGVNGLKIPDWVPGIGGRSLNLPQIPKLAKGGIVSAPTMAMIGEAGTEAVMPLENNTEWIDKLASRISGASNSNMPVNLTIQIGEEKIVSQVIDLINEKTQMSGRNSILV